ncbi:barstar family protein [Terrabacter carboxydivorans]|uniref:Barstar (barnase inhibitor) domain-containing protein n=1 Tax=Terrabacter carboxydivorans TaxID=619730 RepID=A0ABN3L1R2_9MICO
MTTFLGRHSEADDHIEQLRWLGHDVRVVSGGDDKAGVLEAFASGLALPEWFGHNWDALLDALRDLDAPRDAPIELVWDHAAGLRARDRDAYDTVVEILEQVADERDDLHVTVVTR